MALEGCSRRDRPLVGRERELSRLMAAVTEPDGRGAIVAGGTGVGKSHLLERTTGLLLDQGWIALRARGDPTRATPFGSVGSLLPSLDGDPQRWAQVLRRGLDHLVEKAAPQQPLLAADDLHAFDAASATLVQHAVLDGRVRLIGSFRTGDRMPDAITALWKEDVVERFDLLPLNRPESDELVELLVDGPVDAETRTRLWHWTEGNPLFLTEVVAHARGRGNWHRTAGLWHLDHNDGQRHRPVLSPTLAGILHDRMAGAPPGVVDAVDALALAGHLPLAVLEHLVGHRMLALAERLRLTRTLHEANRRVLTLGHPLYGELRRASLSDQRTTEIRSRVLEVFERFEDVAASEVALLARWYAETGRTGPRAADLLTRAAELAWAGKDPRTAVELARRARQLGSGNRSGLVLVDALARLGEGRELREVADVLTRTAPSDDVRAKAVMGRALFLFQFANRPDEAEQLLATARSGIGDPRWCAALVKQAALFRLQRGDLAGAEALIRPLRASADAATAADGAAVIAAIRLMQGRVGEALELADPPGGGWSLLVGFDDVVADPLMLSEHVLHEIGGGVEADRLRRADEITQRAIAALDDEVDPLSRAFMALRVGRIARLRGRPRTAARWFREAAVGFDAVHREGFVAWALAALVDVQAQIGDRTGARESAARCRARRNHPIGLAAGEVARCLAWELVAAQRLEEAADALAAAGQRSLLGDEVLHAARAFHDLARIGRADRAVDRLEALAARSDAHLVTTFARHARAILVGDATELEAVARRFASLGCDLHAAEAWSQAARASHAGGQDRRAAAAQREALASRRQCEGARTPLLATSAGAADLSQREREIAHLARSGMRRRDIAARLVISPRTVDSHLQRIYRKLGVGDRYGLAAALPNEMTTSRGRALTQ